MLLASNDFDQEEMLEKIKKADIAVVLIPDAHMIGDGVYVTGLMDVLHKGMPDNREQKDSAIAALLVLTLQALADARPNDPGLNVN
jgi:hypothetical protein